MNRLYLNFLCLPFSVYPLGTGDEGLGELGALLLLNLGGRPRPLFTGNIVIFFILLGFKARKKPLIKINNYLTHTLLILGQTLPLQNPSRSNKNVMKRKLRLFEGKSRKCLT